MHLANASMLDRWLADGCGGGPFGVRYLLHAFSAFANAGPLNVTPWTVSAELPGVAEIDRPCPPGPWLGSGNLEMPFARMQCDSPRGEASPEAVVAPTAVPPLPPEEPQAQSATAQPAVDSATASRTAVALRL